MKYIKVNICVNRDGKSRFIMSVSNSVLQKTWLENMFVQSGIDILFDQQFKLHLQASLGGG